MATDQKRGDFPLLQQQYGQLRTRENSIQASGEQINSQLNGLQQVWRGIASDSFREAATVWQRGFQEVMDAFTQLNQLLDQTVVNFSESEQKLAAQSGTAFQS